MPTILEIKKNRFGYLVPIVIICALLYIVYRFVLQGHTIISIKNNNDAFFKILPYIMLLIGTLIIIYFGYCFINPPLIFLANEKGFMANYNGRTTGCIIWDDVKETKEIEITNYYGDKRFNNEYNYVIAVFLKNKDGYVNGKNKLASEVIKSLINKYGTSIFIYKASVNSKDYQQIRNILLNNANYKTLQSDD